MIVQLGMSQNDYPKLTLIDGDTLILFKPIQVAKMNKTFLELDKSLEINLSLSEEIKLYQLTDSVHKAQQSIMLQREDALVNINKEKDLQIEILTEQNKKQQKTIKLLKKTRNLFTLGGVVVGGVGTYFLLRNIK